MKGLNLTQKPYVVTREDLNMTTAASRDKKLHYDLTNVGLRAQATAAGLVQLCVELRRAGIIDNDALDRIKISIADEIVVCAPRPVDRSGYRRDIRDRLDRLFAGLERLGSGDELNPSATD